MNEIMSGEGLLEEWDNPGTSYTVEYRFTISDVRAGGLGRVVASTPFPLADGVYRLETQDGTTIKVRNLGSGVGSILKR